MDVWLCPASLRKRGERPRPRDTRHSSSAPYTSSSGFSNSAMAIITGLVPASAQVTGERAS